MVVIRELREDDVESIPRVLGGPAWHGGIEKWSLYWKQHQAGRRTCLVAHDDDIVGYASVVWRSQHRPFAQENVPELQDLVVAENRRGQGLGAALVAACEAVAAKPEHREIGIGFGLYADYGAAQRLYVRLGYVPDGHGLTWNNQPAKAGDMVCVDDDLVLWLRKPLAKLGCV